MVKRTMGTVEWALVGLLALLWGGTFYFVEIMLEAMDPVSAVLVRVAPAAALTILVHGSGLRLPGDFATWRALFIMGLLNNVLPFTLITWGQTHIESGLAAILNATTPLFTVVLAHWLTRDADFLDRRGASHGLDVRGFISHHLGAGRRRRGALPRPGADRRAAVQMVASRPGKSPRAYSTSRAGRSCRCLQAPRETTKHSLRNHSPPCSARVLWVASR